MATKKAVVHPIDPFLFDGPSFQNFVFHLKSSSNAPNHIVTITSQTSVNTNFAFIQGTWQGDGPNAKQITGSITDGTVSLTASWACDLQSQKALARSVLGSYGVVGEWNGGH
jgi:hypothetical protein